MPGPCCNLSPEGDQALQGLIPIWILHPDSGPWCGLAGESRTPIDVLRDRKSELLPCLVDIYWHGTSRGDACKKSARPDDGRWVFTYIRFLDERVAAGLFETEVARGSPYAIGYKTELFRMGLTRYLPDLLAFLREGQGKTAPRNFKEASWQERILDVIAATDAKDALVALREIRDGGGFGNWKLDLVIAQLARDVPALLALAHTGDPPDPPPVHVLQIVSTLDRIGHATEALEILRDRASRSGPYQVWARNEIALRTGAAASSRAPASRPSERRDPFLR